MSETHDDVLRQAILTLAATSKPIGIDEIRDRPVVDIEPSDGDSGYPATSISRLNSLDLGDADMAIEVNPDLYTRDAGRRGRLSPRLVLAAAGIIVALLAIGVTLRGGDGEVEVGPATNPPVVDPPNADLTRRTGLVDAFVIAYSAGDLDAARLMFTDSHRDLDNKLVTEEYVAAGVSWTRNGACTVDLADALICPIVQRDDFHGAAGLSFETDYVFAFDAEDRIDRLKIHTADPWDDYLAFRAAFRNWMAESHPEVSMTYYPPAGSYSDELADMPRADSMSSAIDYVDHFVSQSPEFGP